MASETANLRKTPLNGLARELGGRMVEFGGWDMAVQFSGILDEHQAVRERAGLFDVSHMGEVEVRGPQALDLLQKLTCNDVSKLADGRCQYNALLYANGGFVDDILIYRHAADDYLVVVNAANTDKDFEWMKSNAAGFEAELKNASAEYAQLALQGPLAEKVLQRMTELDLPAMRYYRFARGKVEGIDAIVSRTGYTGEDGFEVYVAPEAAEGIARRILEHGRGDRVLPTGLGARDTLRLEAKMALYGNDIDDTTTPLNADLGWIIKLDKGEFIGRDVLEKQIERGIDRLLVGFEMVDRGIARHGYPVVEGENQIGIVTSGTHSPTLKKAIGLAYLPPGKAEVGAEFTVLIRGKEARARVVPTPFYKRSR